MAVSSVLASPGTAPPRAQRQAACAAGARALQVHGRGQLPGRPGLSGAQKRCGQSERGAQCLFGGLGQGSDKVARHYCAVNGDKQHSGGHAATRSGRPQRACSERRAGGPGQQRRSCSKAPRQQADWCAPGSKREKVRRAQAESAAEDGHSFGGGGGGGTEPTGRPRLSTRTGPRVRAALTHSGCS